MCKWLQCVIRACLLYSSFAMYNLQLSKQLIKQNVICLVEAKRNIYTCDKCDESELTYSQQIKLLLANMCVFVAVISASTHTNILKQSVTRCSRFSVSNSHRNEASACTKNHRLIEQKVFCDWPIRNNRVLWLACCYAFIFICHGNVQYIVVIHTLKNNPDINILSVTYWPVDIPTQWHNKIIT